MGAADVAGRGVARLYGYHASTASAHDASAYFKREQLQRQRVPRRRGALRRRGLRLRARGRAERRRRGRVLADARLAPGVDFGGWPAHLEVRATVGFGKLNLRAGTGAGAAAVLKAAGASDLQVVDGDAVAGSRTLVVRGRIAGVRAALGALAYAPDTHWNGVDVLELTASDGGDAAYGGRAEPRRRRVRGRRRRPRRLAEHGARWLVPYSRSADTLDVRTPRLGDLDGGEANREDASSTKGTYAYANSHEQAAAGLAVAHVDAGDVESDRHGYRVHRVRDRYTLVVAARRGFVALPTAHAPEDADWKKEHTLVNYTLAEANRALVGLQYVPDFNWNSAAQARKPRTSRLLGFSGEPDAVAAALGALNYAPDADFAGDDAVLVTASDRGTAARAATGRTLELPVEVRPTCDAPVVAPRSRAYATAEDAAATVGFDIFDEDHANLLRAYEAGLGVSGAVNATSNATFFPGVRDADGGQRLADHRGGHAARAALRPGHVGRLESLIAFRATIAAAAAVAAVSYAPRRDYSRRPSLVSVADDADDADAFPDAVGALTVSVSNGEFALGVLGAGAPSPRTRDGPVDDVDDGVDDEDDDRFRAGSRWRRAAVRNARGVAGCRDCSPAFRGSAEDLAPSLHDAKTIPVVVAPVPDAPYVDSAYGGGASVEENWYGVDALNISVVDGKGHDDAATIILDVDRAPDRPFLEARADEAAPLYRYGGFGGPTGAWGPAAALEDAPLLTSEDVRFRLPTLRVRDVDAEANADAVAAAGRAGETAADAIRELVRGREVPNALEGPKVEVEARLTLRVSVHFGKQYWPDLNYNSDAAGREDDVLTVRLSEPPSGDGSPSDEAVVRVQVAATTRPSSPRALSRTLARPLSSTGEAPTTGDGLSLAVVAVDDGARDDGGRAPGAGGAVRCERGRGRGQRQPTALEVTVDATRGAAAFALDAPDVLFLEPADWGAWNDTAAAAYEPRQRGAASARRRLPRRARRGERGAGGPGLHRAGLARLRRDGDRDLRRPGNFGASGAARARTVKIRVREANDPPTLAARARRRRLANFAEVHRRDVSLVVHAALRQRAGLVPRRRSSTARCGNGRSQRRSRPGASTPSAAQLASASEATFNDQ
ncbi:hypothetical protein JL722_3366 [Aureococcus anophagefferens]|nr:hypothetical protein JL722_3366 [Aureococcus anophagefferens]